MNYIEDREGRSFLLLLGGVDVDPSLYNRIPHTSTQKPNRQRDEAEQIAFNLAVKDGIPIVGICRGAQFICVMNGGLLHQHTLNHGCNHPIITTTGDGVVKEASAGHHQVMNPKGDYEVLGYDGRSSVIQHHNGDEDILVDAPEVVYYPRTKSISIQPHPEWMSSKAEFNIWISKMLYSYLGIQYNLGQEE